MALVHVCEVSLLGKWGKFFQNLVPSLHSKSVTSREAVQFQIPKDPEDERQKGGSTGTGILGTSRSTVDIIPRHSIVHIRCRPLERLR